MAGTAFSIKFDVGPLTALADKLSALTPERLGGYLVAAINDTADSAYELGRKRILNGINLTDDYVQRKMRVDHATEQKPTATITAFGGRGFLTGLSHYGAMQRHRDVNWSNADIVTGGFTFGPWPGWTRRKGNAPLGIPVDRKASGRSVEVVKGRRKVIGPAFAIPGKKDADGNPVVFTRDRGTRTVKALSGPSVYQLFRVAAVDIRDQVGNELEQAVIDVAERRLREELS